MRIHANVYESLTPRQRLIAAVEAIARKDDPEIERLNTTCPKITYKQADLRYADALKGIVTMAITTELHLTSGLLSCIASSKAGMEDAADQFLQITVNRQAAWSRYMQSQGISPDVVETLVKDLRHPIVAYTFREGREGLPDPEEQKVAEEVESIDKFFSRFK